MPFQDVIKKAEAAMKKSVEHFQTEIAKVRTGRANAAMLDNVRVDYYGNPSPLSSVATVTVPDAKTIVVQPWERQLCTPIERAIREADLGLNPMNDGTLVRVPVPPLTEERRKDIVKMCNKDAEANRVAIRNHRRDHIEMLKKVEKDEKLSEDDRKRSEEQVQKLTDQHIKLIDEIFAKKEKEVMSV